MRIEGAFKAWNDDRGFGFIQRGPGEPDVFVHINNCQLGALRPSLGMRVSLEVSKAADGKLSAKEVRLLKPTPGSPTEQAAVKQRREPREPARTGRGWDKTSLIALGVLVGSFSLISIIWQQGAYVWMALGYVVMSCVSALVYVFDKDAAERGLWRVSEETLHVIDVLGGWPGAILVQQLLRHKTAKMAFRVVFWTSVIMNMLVCWGLMLLLRNV